MRQAKASIYATEDDCPWLVTESPAEVEALVTKAIDDDQLFVRLTLGNDSEWNGKPLLLRASRIVAISPPKDQNADEDE